MIYLIGFMGAGKTSFAQKIAIETNLTFVDIDWEIEKKENRTIKSIFQNEGEEYFRQIESAMLIQVSGGIIAAGGGIIEKMKNRKHLKNNTDLCIWLNLPWPIIESRIINSARPLAHNNSSVSLYKLWKKRLPLYSQSSHTICHSFEETKDFILDYLTKKRAGL